MVKLSKTILLFFLLISPSFASENSNLTEKTSVELQKNLNNCVSSLATTESRTLFNLSSCLFQFRQLLVLNDIQPDRIKDFPELLTIREKLDKYLDTFLDLMLTPQSNIQVPKIASASPVYTNSRQLIELLAILQFSPVRTREMLNETIASYNNLIVLLGIINQDQMKAYPILNSIGLELERIRKQV